MILFMMLNNSLTQIWLFGTRKKYIISLASQDNVRNKFTLHQNDYYVLWSEVIGAVVASLLSAISVVSLFWLSSAHLRL